MHDLDAHAPLVVRVKGEALAVRVDVVASNVKSRALPAVPRQALERQFAGIVPSQAASLALGSGQKPPRTLGELAHPVRHGEALFRLLRQGADPWKSNFLQGKRPGFLDGEIPGRHRIVRVESHDRLHAQARCFS